MKQHIDSNNIPTANGFGWTSDIPNPITRKFLDFISERRSPSVIDIGVGLGVASLPAMRAGAFVIANDISEEHLKHVGVLANVEGFSDRVQLLNAALPKLPELKPLDAVHCSNVLHFLSAAELMKAAKWMFRSTIPGGSVFIQTLSPFAGHFRNFLPVYVSRKQKGDEWPGEIVAAKDFVLPSLRHMTPDFMHVLESEYLAKVFADAGFQIAFCDYYTRPGLPEPCRFDGRENLGLVAHRLA
jgi:2-polyprenyl-3-methyl-5-hydroxy-6-metoxy-1,4-benzoquinol methylase